MWSILQPKQFTIHTDRRGGREGGVARVRHLARTKPTHHEDLVLKVALQFQFHETWAKTTTTTAQTIIRLSCVKWCSIDHRVVCLYINLCIAIMCYSSGSIFALILLLISLDKCSPVFGLSFNETAFAYQVKFASQTVDVIDKF